MGNTRELQEPTYLGDGVYAYDNGYSIELAVNHHENKVVVLEDTVLLALIEYAKRTKLIK